jgi:hypothetical protein
MKPNTRRDILRVMARYAEGYPTDITNIQNKRHFFRPGVADKYLFQLQLEAYEPELDKKYSWSENALERTMQEELLALDVYANLYRYDYGKWDDRLGMER